MCSRACSWPCCKCIPQLKSCNRFQCDWCACLMFSSLQLWFHSGQGLPLLVIFRRFANEEKLRLSDDTRRIWWKDLMYLCSCRRTASNLCSSASFRPSSASVAVANLQLFKPSSLQAYWCQVSVRWLWPGRVRVLRCARYVMKHTSWCLHADCKRRFWTGWYKGEHPRLRSIRP